MLLVYNPLQSQFVYTLAGEDRSTLTDLLELPLNFLGDTVHAWMAFYAADKKSISTSVYVGSIPIA